MKTLLKTEELNGIAVAHPVLYGKAWVIVVAKTSNVRQRYASLLRASEIQLTEQRVQRDARIVFVES